MYMYCMYNTICEAKIKMKSYYKEGKKRKGNNPVIFALFFLNKIDRNIDYFLLRRDKHFCFLSRLYIFRVKVLYKKKITTLYLENYN